jgi:Ni,Fe-hydrogenase I cytochrome b subunit
MATMPIDSEAKLELINNAIQEMALLGYRLDKILVGFKLYHELKGTTNIEEYERILEMYEKGMIAMEDQMQRYHRLFSYLKDLTEE